MFIRPLNFFLKLYHMGSKRNSLFFINLMGWKWITVFGLQNACYLSNSIWLLTLVSFKFFFDQRYSISGLTRLKGL